nr:hypothetical protein [Tanacetum cinerariifolium]
MLHTEPDNSLSIGDEHLDTISTIESDEFIKSSVENLVPTQVSLSDDQSFYDEDILKEIYLNPLFDEEIISMKIDPHHFNVKSGLIESLLNHDSSIISSSSKIDSLFDEFAEINLSVTPDDPMPQGIEEDDYDSERDILIFKELLDNDSLSLLKNTSFHFDIPSFSHPPAKPLDEKSPNLLPHLGHEAFQPSFECPMMIDG